MKKYTAYIACFLILSFLTILSFSYSYDKSSIPERKAIKNKLFESLSLVDDTKDNELIEVAEFLRKTSYLAIPNKSFLRKGFGIHPAEKVPNVSMPTAFIPALLSDSNFSEEWSAVYKEDSIAFQNSNQKTNVIVFKHYADLSRVVIAGVLLHEAKHAMIQLAMTENGRGEENIKAFIHEKGAYELEGKFFSIIGGSRYDKLVEEEALKIKLYHTKNNAFPEAPRRFKELTAIFGNISKDDQEVLEMSLFVSSVFRFFEKNFPNELEKRKFNFFEDGVEQGFFANKE